MGASESGSIMLSEAHRGDDAGSYRTFLGRGARASLGRKRLQYRYRPVHLVMVHFWLARNGCWLVAVLWVLCPTWDFLDFLLQ